MYFRVIIIRMMESGWKRILEDIKKFGRQTTIHGVFFLVSYKLHFFERLFWAIIIATAITSSITLCLSNWNRYSANPTVVSLQKDFRNWNNPFPSATVCFHYKTDESSLVEYIRNRWGINYTDPSYDYYLGFVKAIANVSLYSLEALRNYQNDDSLNDVDMMDLAVKVHPDSVGTLVTFETKDMAKWTHVMTEMGVCFTINSMFSNILAFRSEDRNQDSTKRAILKCHYLNGLCYARFDSEPETPIRVYIHSYFDILHATMSTSWDVLQNQEIELNYRMQETTSDVSLRSLTPTQRGCRFQDEPISNDVPYYSTSICYMLCRYHIIMKLCGCRPFLYHNLGGKVCDLKGLICAANHSQYLLQPPSKLGCDCPQPCHIITYLPQIPKVTLWEYGYFDQRITFRWGLLPPTTKYHRNILFGFEDLVVSFGGIVALFLGISFISVIETVFFIVKIVIHSCQLIRSQKTITNTNIGEN